MNDVKFSIKYETKIKRKTFELPRMEVPEFADIIQRYIGCDDCPILNYCDELTLDTDCTGVWKEYFRRSDTE